MKERMKVGVIIKLDVKVGVTEEEPLRPGVKFGGDLKTRGEKRPIFVRGESQGERELVLARGESEDSLLICKTRLQYRSIHHWWFSSTSYQIRFFLEISLEHLVWWLYRVGWLGGAWGPRGPAA